jgi:hypothetical protein
MRASIAAIALAQSYDATQVLQPKDHEEKNRNERGRESEASMAGVLKAGAISSVAGCTATGGIGFCPILLT